MAADLGKQISLLKTKIHCRLRRCRGEGITARLFTTLQNQIHEYITEIEVRITKLQLSPSSGIDTEQLEEDWLSEQVIFLQEMEDIAAVVIPVDTTQDQTLSSGTTDFPSGSRVSSSFIVKPPQIQIVGPTFSGLEMNKDRMGFRNFLSRFENCVAGMASDAERLNFLKCSLSDKPLLLVNHLSVSNGNYQIALDILKEEYLDIDEIIDNIFQDIIDYFPKQERTYSDLRCFLSKTGSLLGELSGSFACDFSDDLSAGARLLAKIIFSKFPRELKGEVIQLSGRRIPPLSSVLRDTCEAIKRLHIKGSGGLRPPVDMDHGSSRNPPTKSRTSYVHKDASYQVASDLGASHNLPPIICVTFGLNGKTVSANCLIDTGSGRTYLSGEVLKPLGCLDSFSLDCDLRLSTLLGECERRFQEVVLHVDVGSGQAQPFPVLVDEAMDLSVHVPQLDFLLDKIREANYSLAGRFDRGTSDVSIKGIVGLDLISCLGSLQLVPCLQGWAFQIPAGMVPFGEVESFRSPNQSLPVRGARLPFLSVLRNTAQVKSSQLCFVLEKEATYLDPLADFFPDSQVQRGLDRMFSVESLGISEQEEFSDYDQEKIKTFQKSIVLRESKYYVQLPWHADKLSRVPSNHAVSLRILDRVARSLEKRGVYQEYLEVFRQQEQEGIIEEIFVPPRLFKNYTWIPHRPVFKTDPSSTTKIRPVFNCSLKTGDSVSLNEAAYPGLNMTGDMLNLLLSFRIDEYVLLADIRKAFLMIRLELETDRNRFCFFLKDGDRLRCFRYTTIIFGFISSPFILGCILKFHAAQFPADPCRTMMENCFYVDNLITTESNPGRLTDLYTQARGRLLKGGFELQSCSSNCTSLRDQMDHDGTLSIHDSEWEKVLGYRYSPFLEKICVSPVEPCADASTKRQILSEATKVFDPLSLCLPVTIRSRVLVGELWKRGLGWDERVPEEFQSRWRALAQDLAGLSQIHFKRQAFGRDRAGDLFVFCDASAEAYGFVAYVVQNHQSELVFAKAKVAPKKSKSLPTLELMAVYLALKCLPAILNGCKGFLPSKLYVASDAQVVLSWILSRSITSKNIFARNRLQDVAQLSEDLESRFGLSPSFKYVHTAQNPADMITRGLSLKKLKSNFEFWCHGPAWLYGTGEPWPSQNLPCLSRHSQQIVHESVNVTRVLEEDYPSVITLERFSDFSRLLRVTTLIFKFVDRLRGLEEDGERKASIYLMKVVQRQAFTEELQYLQDPVGKSLPRLVRDLDLFLDQDGLIRSCGRINRSPHLEYGVKNPVLLGKNHYVTKLIIMDCHSRCSHLGTGSTLNELRNCGYWIPQGRQAVRKALASCALCRRFNARPVLPPNVSSLPPSRVEFEVPFKNTGMDFTGHFWIKEGNSQKKMYLLLFTCLSVRAVHLEVVPDMSILSFFQALVRFTNLFGVPSTLYCDNAKTFLGSGKLFSRLSVYHEYQEKFGSCHLKLKTIPLFSPWFGGAWERCIQTIKTCLYKIIGRGSVNYFFLLTIISDIERAVNNRPLTYRAAEDRELEAITPNMFLRPNKSPGLLLHFEEGDSLSSGPPSRQRLIESMELRNTWLQEFQHIWYQEYLLSLREKSCGRSRVPYRNRLKIDDVVMVKSPLKPRPFWILGTVVELFKGDDGVVRSARIRQGDGHIRVHSLRHLYPLELSTSPNFEREPEMVTPITPEGHIDDINRPSPSEDENEVWLCPTCNAPQGDQNMIACDLCDEWYHFTCVGVAVSPPERQKWYCPECAPRRRRRGRPSLLPA